MPRHPPLISPIPYRPIPLLLIHVSYHIAIYPLLKVPYHFLSNAHSYLSHSTVNLSSLYHSLPSSPITFRHKSTVSTISYRSLLTRILAYHFLPSIHHLSTIPKHPLQPHILTYHFLPSVYHVYYSLSTRIFSYYFLPSIYHPSTIPYHPLLPHILAHHFPLSLNFTFPFSHLLSMSPFPDSLGI